MTIVERETIEHEIGAAGRLTIRAADGPVEVIGIEGTTARIQGSGSRRLEDDYRIRREPESLELTAIGSWPLRLLRLEPRCQPIQVSVPAGTIVLVETVSGEIRAAGISGDQHYRSTSGDVDVRTGGRVDAESVSGRVTVHGAVIQVQARTVSGELDVRGGTIAGLRARTTSGDLAVAGTFDGPGPFSVETGSGGVSVRPVGPVRIEGTTVTGDVRSTIPHRSAGGPGRRAVELGDGGPVVTFRSISGDLRVEADPGREAASPVGARVESIGEGTDHEALVTGATEIASGSATAEEARLGVLRELEHGSIDVAEAGRRLTALDASTAGSRPGEVSRMTALAPTSVHLALEGVAWVRRV